MWYLLLKIIHILSAILALGANLTYGFLLYKAEREPQHLPFMLHTIQWIDRNVANRGYILVLVTGLTMIWLQGYTFSSLWIWVSLLLFIAIALLGIFVYAPVISEQIRLADQQQTQTQAYHQIRKKSNRIGVIVTLLVVIILFLMVMKPVE